MLNMGFPDTFLQLNELTEINMILLFLKHKLTDVDEAEIGLSLLLSQSK